MDFSETLLGSLRAIMANRLRSFLTVLGVVIGVMSVILLVSLVSGLNRFITDQIQGLGSNLIFVIPGRVGGARSPGGVQANRLTNLDATNLKRSLSGQAQVSAVVQKTGTLKYGSKDSEAAAIFGVEASFNKIISIDIVKGRFFSEGEEDSGKRVAVVGPTVSKNLFGEGDPIGKSIDVSGLKYQIVGEAEARGSAFGVDQDNSVSVPLAAAQKQFGLENLNTIYISANESKNVDVVEEKVTEILAKRISKDDFTVMTQEETLSTIGQVTGALTVALAGISAISLIVGGIGVMNIMLVSVTERTREIGLRKALGAKSSDIRNQFLIESVVLTSLGGIVGITLGILLSLLIGRFINTSVTLWSVGISFAFSVVIGVIFGVAPAVRASRLDPIQALRYE